MRVSAKPIFLLAAVLVMILAFYSERVSQRAVEQTGYAIPTANPGASSEARQLLQYLYEIKGRYTLAGQHNFLEDPDYYTKRMKSLTGEYPALIGFEMGVVLDHSESEVDAYREEVIREAIAVSRAGSMVTMTYHQALPGECMCWKHVNNGGISTQEFEAILTPGTPQYEEWVKDVDEVAHYLKQLRDAKVPVLWRPYHEMNGGWFWWGKQSGYQKLWDQMYERYTHVHGLNNLLWVWSPNAPNNYADSFESYYVGHLRADVLAVDIYHNDYKSTHHDRLWKLGDGKPIAIGENGGLPDPKLLQEAQHQYVWFMGWGNELEDTNGMKRIQDMYRDERVWTRNNLQLLSK